MTAYTKSGIALRAENRSQGAVFVMAATDPSAVFFCAHGSHDECIATPVNGHPNHDGLQFAKPNLQSVFKKPAGDTVGGAAGTDPGRS
jgi:hypothetical protein